MLSSTLRTAAVLALATVSAAVLPSRPAEAQSTVWSATLTVDRVTIAGYAKPHRQ